MTQQQVFQELAKLARDRCRKSNESVLQLLDNEPECAALLIAVATDMIYGASSFLGDDKAKALQSAVAMLHESLRFLETRREASR